MRRCSTLPIVHICLHLVRLVPFGIGKSWRRRLGMSGIIGLRQLVLCTATLACLAAFCPAAKLYLLLPKARLYGYGEQAPDMVILRCCTTVALVGVVFFHILLQPL